MRLLNEGIADHFDTTWITLLSKLLKNLPAWLPREAIPDNSSEAFVKTGNNKSRVILDCAEVLIERPKPMDCQAGTWSDYKQYNTIKTLAGISPSGFLTFSS